MTAPLFHIGYHKTGTTWMQEALFRPALGFRPLMSHEEVFRHIVRPHGLSFDPDPARRLIAERNSCGQANVVSSEILSGNPFLGGRESDIYARRIAEIAPEARILVTIREQISMIVSVYMQYLLRGGTESAERFFADEPTIGYVAFAPEHFEFHRLIGLYRLLFGAERVLVLTQEEMARDPLGFAGQVARFAESPTNIAAEDLPTRRAAPSAPEFCMPLLRRLNHFRAGPAGPGPVIDLGASGKLLYDGISWFGRRPAVQRALARRRPVRRVAERRFGGRFEESNRALEGMLGGEIDLAGYMR